MKIVECLLLMSLSFACHALSWNSLWLTPDQRAQHLMKQKEYQQAQETFKDPSWKAAASYRAGNYGDAIVLYQSLKTEDAFYNQGNAFAQLGKYEQAIKAYDQALALNTEHKDALFNRKLVKALLKKEKQSADQKQEQDSQKNNSSYKPNAQNPSKNESLKKQAENKASEKVGESSSNEAANPHNSQQAPSNPSTAEKAETKPQEKKAALNAEETKASPSLESAEKISLNKEQQLTKEQWLKLIPDDPGGLLREKFLREHLRRQQGW